ncbi:RNA-directed DNA polymerase [Rosistilla oblonga]|uniref:RNA-directed DNA polymerase n=1 Tax=Rosistilla oblonga TaxID=2527990 RepID=UPI003A97FEA8
MKKKGSKKLAKKSVMKKTAKKTAAPKKVVKAKAAKKQVGSKKSPPTRPVVPLPLTDDALKLAIANVANFGDTDVFPFPIENHWFFDRPSEVIEQLQELRSKGEDAFQYLSVFSSTELINTGYLGFRPATQIEPLWNTCFLAAAIQVAEKVETNRQPRDRVFSYRFEPDTTTGSLFAKVGWKDFHMRGLELAKDFSHVALVDISDFYPRIYHHRLENALKTDCQCDGPVVTFIDRFLSKLNGGNSFGLPVGGPAARILAEAVLTRTDRLIQMRRIEYLRFVDDYIVFGNSEDEIRKAILDISRLLLDNEGLSLNRNKTRLLTSDEYQRQSVLADPSKSDSEDETEKRKFLSIHLRYDPYSPTADEDYEKLADSIREYDVLGLLEKELTKSRVDRFALSQLIKALQFMDEAQRSDAVRTLADNLGNMAPVFATTAIAFRKIKDEIADSAAELFFRRVRELVENRSPLIGASGTLAFAVRVLADDPSPDADITLQEIFSQSMLTPVIEREIVLAMVKRKSRGWISDLKSRYTTLSNPWTIRALLAGSFVLGDEGTHWRKATKKILAPYDVSFLSWLSEKNSGQEWEVPL